MPDKTTSNAPSENPYKEADRLLKDGRFADAEHILLDLLEESPNDVWIMCRLGEARFQQDDPSSASEQFIRAVIIDPEFADAHVGLGKITEKFGEIEAALDHYRRALALASERRDLNDRINKLSQNRSQGGKPAGAQDARAIFWKRYKHASELLDSRKLAEAEIIFRELFELEPNNTHVLNKLGQIAGNMGQSGKALAYYVQSTAADPSNLWGYIGQAKMLEIAGDLDGAINALEIVVQRDASMSVAQDRLKALRGKRQQKSAPADARG